MSEVMVDLETLSTRPNAVILIIGAVKFNRDGKIGNDLNKLDTFYRRIEIDSCTKLGMHVDKKTQEWWNEQDKEIRHEALTHPDRIILQEALVQFTKWFGTSELIWGHGDDFDCTILGEAYKRCGMEVPWKFWNTRDTRTLFDLANIKPWDLPNENKHHALYDCHRQIVGVQMSVQKILG